VSRFSNMSFKARLALVAAGAVALAVIAASAVVFLVVRNELRRDFDNGLRICSSSQGIQSLIGAHEPQHGRGPGP
jgi:hypothetical protein